MGSVQKALLLDAGHGVQELSWGKVLLWMYELQADLATFSRSIISAKKNDWQITWLFGRCFLKNKQGKSVTSKKIIGSILN